ncbi:hypothetical protein A374_08809 [Fictibacillus macauensis ZFHKF-1]|uniref:Uncharacterized protein n=1 Tax=Fictibacillus macauensis ZFHKF-1 TaxID=1196324 RepID=I8UGG7_9BACL|nr:helix-turn-helix domain-containing protein [Fictibacillus macauensis]EIT85923.1 hypothetical protein A374_08809 [Fictibacillus macauensis ZFHKF-1]
MKKKTIDQYMTIIEAAYRWGVPVDTLKNKLKPSIISQRELTQKLIDEGLIKFFQAPEKKRKDWIISAAAMDRWFGEKNNV